MSDNPSFEVDSPDHFAAGAVGPPGQRVFYLQSRDAGRLITLKVEKEHVRALAEYLGGLLARVKGAPGVVSTRTVNCTLGSVGSTSRPAGPSAT